MTLQLNAASDFTAVARFDHVLQPSKEYVVFLRSKKLGCEVQGRFRTFATPGTKARFEFFHGSCNLPIARLTALGGVAAGVTGGAAARLALRRPSTRWHRQSLRWFARIFTYTPFRQLSHLFLRLARWLFGGFILVVNRLTRYEQPIPSEQADGTGAPRLPSPFARLLDEMERFDETDQQNGRAQPLGSRPAFMIHAGDQIYVDVDFRFPWPKRRSEKHAASSYERSPTQENYRRNYRQAWFEDPATTEFLTRLPHYMILDDHEIIDGFGNNARDDEHRFLRPALNAYDEYVSSRQPQPPPADPLEPHARHKGYSFEYGDAGFFVLDTRTKRSVDEGLLIQREQEEELLRWIEGKPPYRNYAVRFVVSSVPFVAETRPPTEDKRNPYSQRDKWSGNPWRGQRARIIRAIHEHLSGGLVFLVGDMHCSYHATMQVGAPANRTTFHELAGGPINQLRFARRDVFFDQYHGECDPNEGPKEKEREPLPWTSTMQAFHGAAASVLRVGVDPEALEVTWEVVRLSQPQSKSAQPRSLSGLIRFQGRIQELRW